MEQWTSLIEGTPGGLLGAFLAILTAWLRLRDKLGVLDTHTTALEGIKSRLLTDQEITSMRDTVALARSNADHLRTDKARLDRLDQGYGEVSRQQGEDRVLLARLDERVKGMDEKVFEMLEILRDGHRSKA